MIYGGLFDVDKKQIRIGELELTIKKEDFWSSVGYKDVLTELSQLKDDVSNISVLKKEINDSLTLARMLKEDDDAQLHNELEMGVDRLRTALDDLSLRLMFNGPYDSCDCILDIHPGAGGTESCDWANMLYRMYTRYCERHGYKIEVLDFQNGEEAGIKSVSMVIHGKNCYGCLKNERGVHRLIRISPFDSNNRRHTSFASVDITPVYNNDIIDIDIKDSDLRVDVYRSSGKGGQGVNTTDSAVRITHLPTKIVVTCQNERSQIRNKEIALNVLKNKLYQLEVDKREKELSNFKGESMDINFGSQIRTYTMHPYSLVKDHRTNYETSNVNKVLDGDLDEFINENLKRGIK